MKIFGLLLILVGIAISIFVGYLVMKDKDRMLSPIPEDNGVRVIYVTPTP